MFQQCYAPCDDCQWFSVCGCHPWYMLRGKSRPLHFASPSNKAADCQIACIAFQPFRQWLECTRDEMRDLGGVNWLGWLGRDQCTFDPKIVCQYGSLWYPPSFAMVTFELAVSLTYSSETKVPLNITTSFPLFFFMLSSRNWGLQRNSRNPKKDQEVPQIISRYSTVNMDRFRQAKGIWDHF